MPFRVGLRVFVLLGAVLAASSPGEGEGSDEVPSGPLGFTPASLPAQAKAEAQALIVPTPEKARAWLRTLTEEPHVAGTLADYKTAVFVRDKLQEWGWKADLAEYEVLLNYPVVGPGSPSLELIRPAAKALPLMEDPLNADKDSASPAAWPAFHGYGISGDVQGQVVYANLARPEDFAALETHGVDVKGKIVLARYGGLFRGLKVLNAQKRGAAGILIYSDPADDGYARGDVYPTGPFRPPSAIQRGSVQFLSHQPGDPSTPNGPSTKGAKRLPIDTANGFPVSGNYRFAGQQDVPSTKSDAVNAWEQETGLKRDEYFAAIPALPISYAAAQPILEALGGPDVPSGWQGGLPLTYHLGPGPAEVHFTVRMEYKIRPVWNVIATIKGQVEPDRWILIGNHRDAWVYGAVDPSSGTATTLEMCRAIGTAVKGGWKPRRTLVYASWDAEEYGLVGSTEWAEDHAQELDSKAVLMLNVDSAVSGPDLEIEGIPSMRDMVLDAAASILDPRTNKTLRETWLARKRSQWAGTGPLDLDERVWSGQDARSSPTDLFAPMMGWMGSGSDYTPFVAHLGIPAVDVDFSGRYGVYHSIYDNFFWMEKFGDPEFLLHATAARLYTVIAMRAAAADLVPLRFVPYGEALREHVDDLRRTIVRKARAITPSSGKTPVEFLGLPKLVSAVRDFQAQAESLDRTINDLGTRDGVENKRLVELNDALMSIERAFLNPTGLPARPWMRHSVYAPGLTTGYASWPLPGVRQAILEENSKMLEEQLPILVQRLHAATGAMATAARLAREAAKR
jgi:N-acetylated-alpha-linked acidic dipeptidase